MRVGVIADVLDPNVTDFVRRDGSHVVTRYVDVAGDGADPAGGGDEMFGDASAIGAQGRTVYDVADGSNNARVAFPGGHCYIRVVGVAPGADIVAINAGADGSFDDIALLQGIDYAVMTAHVDVLNESFGGSDVPDDSADNAVAAADAAATAAGTTVVVSSGDAGVNSTIGSPAAQADVIRVGASLTNRSYLQTARGLSDSDTNPDHTWTDDDVSAISSSGTTQEARTVDLVAPGDSNWSVCEASKKFASCTNTAGNPSSLQLFAGTSQSAPLTSATAALVIQAYRETHHGTSPAPAIVKEILTGSADDLGLPGTLQGAGRLDAARAIAVASSWPGGSTTAGTTAAVSSPTQLSVAGPPGSTHHRTLTITNAGSTPETVSIATRRAVVTGGATANVQLDPDATPVITGEFGGAEAVHQRVPLNVPADVDHATVAIAWPRSSVAVPLVLFSVFGPDGQFVANSNPQSSNDPQTNAIIGPQYSQLTVRTPKPGRYTVDVYTFARAGVRGLVRLSAQYFTERAAAPAQPAASVLQAGRSMQVTVPVSVPTDAGDSDQDVVVSTGAHSFAVPVIVRSALPVAAGPAHFVTTVYGGNGRPQSPVQTATYEMAVPPGHRDLSVDIASGCGCALEAVLIDPYGQVQSDVTNTNPHSGDQVPSLSLTAATPTSGRWRLVISVNDVSGTATTSRLTGTAQLDHRHVSAHLPTSSHTTLRRGTTTTVPLTVTNNSPMPLAIETEARTARSVTAPLVSLSGTGAVTYPDGGDAVLVPFDTTRLAMSMTASNPIRGELTPVAAPGISLVSDATNGGSNATLNYAVEHGITAGPWSVEASTAVTASYPQSATQAAAGSATTGTARYTATATTAGFDRTISTPQGDQWLASIDAHAAADHPLLVTSGRRVTIPVHFRPTAPIGSTVRGTLLVLQITDSTLGSVLARLPYSYTVAATHPPAPSAGPAGHSQHPLTSTQPAAVANTGPSDLPTLTLFSGACLVLGIALSIVARRRKPTPQT